MAGIIVLTTLAGLIYFVRRPVVTPQDEKTPNTTVKNQYVDPSICADCHPKIAETYLRTGMGRSFSRPTTANTIGDPKKPVTFYHKPSDSYFTNIEHDGKFFQRRYQIGFDGKETNSFEKEIQFVMGSGNHARAYLHRSNRNTLIELPLGWYAENGGSWAMSPGYDRPDHPGFTRAVTDGCMFCHNGIPGDPINVRTPPGGGGKKFRAYDKATGEVLSELDLPAGTTGAPMTYMYKGKQYIVVAVGSTDHAAEFVALTLR